MFTGLVEEVGIVKEIMEADHGKIFHIHANIILQDIKIGDSILVNGACQTVESFDTTSFQIFSVPETLKITNFNNLAVGSKVNLERALRPIDRFGGHIVQGHIEDTAIVHSIDTHEKYWDIHIKYLSPLLIPKGSITIDGISLTIHSIQDDSFHIQIIPETILKTNISSWYVNYRVNIEIDYLIKIIQSVYKNVQIL